MVRIRSSFRVAFVAIAALGSIMLADVAEAASCRAMKAELASLKGKSSSPRYAKAAKRQRGQMAQVKRLLRRHSCDARGSSACTTLRRSLADMRKNLRVLERKAEAPGSKVRRARLRRKISKRCEERPPRVAKKASRKVKRSKRRVAIEKSSKSKAKKSASRTFATMCVRLCDGFAFPVSLSTAPAQFAADAKACNALCPGVDLRLYAVPARVSRVKDARDVETGKPYSALSTAFRHRKVYDSACRCKFSRARLDYGTPVSGHGVKAKATFKPAPDVRVVGPDYFRVR